MEPLSSDLLAAMRSVSEDAQSRSIFNAIVQEGGKTSGWALAKQLGQDPEILKVGIEKLRSLRIVDSTGSGLEGYYYLTQLGFQLRSSMIRA
ncbi:MAG: hypothetical protein DMF60_20270 [Acidobacteria bacterium]|nr:MAG: hypothetical protein DMF60_20270 [Acidobacteriota bacterium]